MAKAKKKVKKIKNEKEVIESIEGCQRTIAKFGARADEAEAVLKDLLKNPDDFEKLPDLLMEYTNPAWIVKGAKESMAKLLEDQKIGPEGVKARKEESDRRVKEHQDRVKQIRLRQKEEKKKEELEKLRKKLVKEAAAKDASVEAKEEKL